MMFIILDKNPEIAVDKLPRSIRFKQLIELMQLLSSANLTDVYKKIHQGKELVEWIQNNKEYTAHYFEALCDWCYDNINLSCSTMRTMANCSLDLMKYIDYNSEYNIKNILFRYLKDYDCNIKSKTLLPANKAIKEYKKYVLWKIERGIWKK